MKNSVALQSVTQRHYNSFSTWIWDRKPLTTEETEFLKHHEDFVALADGREDGWFDGFIEDLLGCLPRSLARVCHDYSYQ